MSATVSRKPLHFIESLQRCVFRTRASDGAADHFNKEPKTIHDGVRPFRSRSYTYRKLKKRTDLLYRPLREGKVTFERGPEPPGDLLFTCRFLWADRRYVRSKQFLHSTIALDYPR